MLIRDESGFFQVLFIQLISYEILFCERNESRGNSSLFFFISLYFWIYKLEIRGAIFCDRSKERDFERLRREDGKCLKAKILFLRKSEDEVE